MIARNQHIDRGCAMESGEESSCIGKCLALGGIGISLLWLLNLTAGIIEIPDNLPIIGNIDEAVMTGILLACLRLLGVDLLPWAKTGKSAKIVKKEDDPS